MESVCLGCVYHTNGDPSTLEKLFFLLSYQLCCCSVAADSVSSAHVCSDVYIPAGLPAFPQASAEGTLGSVGAKVKDWSAVAGGRGLVFGFWG